MTRLYLQLVSTSKMPSKGARSAFVGHALDANAVSDVPFTPSLSRWVLNPQIRFPITGMLRDDGVQCRLHHS